MAKTKTKSRSAKTGKYVKKSFAKKHPGTTVSEKTGLSDAQKFALKAVIISMKRMINVLESLK